MIVPDINLLLYAYDSDSQWHADAAAWWEACLSAGESVGLAYPVVFGFLRIATSPRVFERPMSVDEACGHIDSWMERSVTQVLEPGASHVTGVRRLLNAAGAGGGTLVTDARIAALAIAYKAVVHTADHDFERFPGLRTRYPVG